MTNKEYIRLSIQKHASITALKGILLDELENIDDNNINALVTFMGSVNTHISGAFKQADDVVFDISPLQKIGTDIRKVVTGRGQLSKPEIVPTGLVDETGQAITRTTTPVETAVPLDKLPTEVLDVIKDLKSLKV